MTTRLWTSEAAHKATGGKLVGEWAVNGISIDTRSLEPGDLFVALKDQRDGHDFVDNAYVAGAAACLVSKSVGQSPSLVVDDTLNALEALGRAARARTSAHCMAITGSVGKTSVKEMLAQIFRAQGPAHWSVKSFNNHWGVPLTLARMPEATLRAIFEIGMNTPGEIAPRSRMVEPHTAIITKIAPAHLEGVGSIEGVAEEKSDIFAGLQVGGAAILPADDRFRTHLSRRAIDYQPKAKCYYFGTVQDAHVRVVDIRTDGLYSHVSVEVFGERVTVEIRAVGEHWGVNVAAAILAAVQADMSAQQAAEALSGYGPPPGRGTAEDIILPGGGKALLVDDAYNANPESMRAALVAFGARSTSRKLVAIGEMLELGPDADTLHMALADTIKAADVESAFICGTGAKPLFEALPGTTQKHFADKPEELFEIVKKSLTSGDALLIKGSNASGIARLGNELRKWSRVNESQVSGDGPVERGEHAL